MVAIQHFSQPRWKSRWVSRRPRLAWAMATTGPLSAGITLLTLMRSHCMLTLGYMKTLGHRIHELREAKDLSLREFAKQLGDISPAHISDIENGRRNPSDELLQKMARVLGVKFEELKQLDSRLPVEALKRAMRQDPAYGFALRKMTEGKVSAEEILKMVEKSRGDKKEGQQ